MSLLFYNKQYNSISLISKQHGILQRTTIQTVL